MDLDDPSLADFEDPAPSENLSLPLPDVADSTRTKRPSKRRLRYRAEVEVTGRRYKGRRVSRADVDLDARSIGLFDDDDILGSSNVKLISNVEDEDNVQSNEEPDSQVSSEPSDVEAGQDDNSGDDPGDVDSAEEAALVPGSDDGSDDSHGSGGDSDDDGDNSSQRNEKLNANGLSSDKSERYRVSGATRLVTEQRAILERLNSSKRADEDRAAAVRFQKVSPHSSLVSV